VVVSVAGTIYDAPFFFRFARHLGPLLEACSHPELKVLLKDSLRPFIDMPQKVAPLPKYEARVLKGIWAAAPYLHNGSVPSLAELLKPPAERARTFKVGPAYDIENVGLAKEQTKFDYTYTANADSEGLGRSSGNCNCGHDYGTDLKPEEKKALLEYLKSL
jgi:hypothetical protein